MTKEEKQLYNKNYRLKNIERIKENKRKNYISSHSKIMKQKKRYYEKHKEEIKTKHKEYRKKLGDKYLEMSRNRNRIYRIRHRDRMKERSKQNRIKIRNIVLNHYGNKCACCGENKKEFLCIDHIKGKGCQERRNLRMNCGQNFYYYLIKNNFPDRYRLLCHNCNMSLGFYGYCPHNKLGG